MQCDYVGYLQQFLKFDLGHAKLPLLLFVDFRPVVNLQAAIEAAEPFSYLLCDAAKEVIGLEMAPSAVADAEMNCRHNQIENCRFLPGDIRETLPTISQRPDVLVIDPPRAGMHPDVAKQVLALLPERIVYVSCNPATLARDLVLLKEAYQIAEVQPVDLFPHTHHIESVARLVKMIT